MVLGHNLVSTHYNLVYITHTMRLVRSFVTSASRLLGATFKEVGQL
jgi:hypothetical protein